MIYMVAYRGLGVGLLKGPLPPIDQYIIINEYSDDMVLRVRHLHSC